MSTDVFAPIAEMVLEHINAQHSDALRLVAASRVASPVTVATAVGVDARGLTLEVDGESLIASFPHEVSDPTALRDALVDLVRSARSEVADAPITSIEREVMESSALRTFVTSVSAVRPLTSAMIEITFRGGDLDTYEPGQPDQFLYLLLPPPGRAELTIDSSFTWDRYEQMPAEERPVGAYYTVRRWHPETRALDVVVVLHGDHGPASRWATTAAPGDPVALWGPRTSYEPPDGTTSMLLVADETGMHAAAAILETLPPDMQVIAIIEVADEHEHLSLESKADVEVRWLHRDGREPGSTTMLVDAVRDLDLVTEGLYAWGGAESRCITKVREHLRHEVGMDQEWVSMTGYWRRDLG